MADSLADLKLIGTSVGEYDIVSQLGVGGMGAVYEGLQPLIGKRVAVKVLLPQLSADQELVERFISEARAVNAIGHRGIVDIFSFGTLPQGPVYFVMEYLQGLAFDRLIKERAPLPPGEALGYIEEVCEALAAAHEAGVIHRDIKPSNIFLVDAGRGRAYVKLLDFGIAKLGALKGEATPQTRASMVIGTPDYMSPEQARGAPVSAQTDLYALGCVLFELVTGKRVFRGENPMATMFMHVENPAPQASDFVPGLPPELDDVIAWPLEKNPANRPGSAEEWRAALAAVRALFPDPSPRTPLPRTPSGRMPSVTATERAMTPSGRVPSATATERAMTPSGRVPRTVAGRTPPPAPAVTRVAPRTNPEPMAPLADPTLGGEQGSTRLMEPPLFSPTVRQAPVTGSMPPAPTGWRVNPVLFIGGVFALSASMAFVTIKLLRRSDASGGAEVQLMAPPPAAPAPSGPGAPPEPRDVPAPTPAAPPLAAVEPPDQHAPVVPSPEGRAAGDLPPKTSQPPAEPAQPPVGAAQPAANVLPAGATGARAGVTGITAASLSARIARLDKKLAAREEASGDVDRVLRQFLDQARADAASATTDARRREVWKYLDDVQRQLDGR